jgi:hypothetical protein
VQPFARQPALIDANAAGAFAPGHAAQQEFALDLELGDPVRPQCCGERVHFPRQSARLAIQPFLLHDLELCIALKSNELLERDEAGHGFRARIRCRLIGRCHRFGHGRSGALGPGRRSGRAGRFHRVIRRRALMTSCMLPCAGQLGTDQREHHVEVVKIAEIILEGFKLVYRRFAVGRGRVKRLQQVAKPLAGDACPVRSRPIFDGANGRQPAGQVCRIENRGAGRGFRSRRGPERIDGVDLG